MKIGNQIINRCNECPAYQWGGESTSRGDHGMQCEFDAFYGMAGPLLKCLTIAQS